MRSPPGGIGRRRSVQEQQVLLCRPALFATFSTELPSVHPPQLNPTIIATTAPAAAPCKRRLREFPCRIECTSMTFTLRMGETRTASSAWTCRMRMLIASEPERLFLECYCARRWHRRCRCRERRLRYIGRRFLGSSVASRYSREYLCRGSGAKRNSRSKNKRGQHPIEDFLYSVSVLETRITQCPSE
jgi:hypothetical protein